ncbi:hypothetical protein AGDE_10175 [Angomonas deanei]|uniref:Uncharacterized protein n=1 Tax=Angomonas deanei TaxID=59799 RepID=A0A7G2CUK5_9TRYP|nr:hypothetical protein AGDE_10175 [Angomonas deanei]CAD2222917.1 hypothetical protein, conserved [Angomonas deanei]|eukprot:EPY29001.1 hypothetical protein AGDE_10175 [Angomonas deanei]
MKKCAILIATLLALLTVSAQQTCSVTDDPYATAAVTELEYCVKQRCAVTVPGEEITSFTNGLCNGDGSLEKDVDCTVLLNAYRAYYNCLVHSVTFTGDALTEAQLFANTPGVPLSLTNFGCYGCNNFRDVVQPAVGTTCEWSCDTCCGQSSDRTTGYGHVLCGIGCTTALMMIPFTVVTMALFLACCLCCSSPMLKETAARLQEEEENAKTAKAPESSESDVDLEATRQVTDHHEPVSDHHSEPHGNNEPIESEKKDDDELREL